MSWYDQYLHLEFIYTTYFLILQADIAALEERLHEEEQRAASKVSAVVLSVGLPYKLNPGKLRWTSYNRGIPHHRLI